MYLSQFILFQNLKIKIFLVKLKFNKRIKKSEKRDTKNNANNPNPICKIIIASITNKDLFVVLKSPEELFEVVVNRTKKCLTRISINGMG